MEYSRNGYTIQGVISLERNFILVYHDLWNFDFRFEQVCEMFLEVLGNADVLPNDLPQ